LQQSTQGAELNSEATLNCQGKEFKCVNSTHYQPCSLTERSGLEPQWTINGVVLPCLAGQQCSDESAINCAAARVAQPIENEVPSQIPVEVTVVQEPVAVAAVAAVEAPVESIVSPAKSLPAEEAAEKPAAVEAAPAPAMEVAPAPASVVVSTEKDLKPEKPADVPAPAPAPAAASNATAVDALKAEQEKPAKKKFSWKGLKKVGPIRLVKGFRPEKLRPKIALDTEKEIADNVRQKLFERRNKYEKFVDHVLGKASPVKKEPVPGAVREPGCEDDNTCEESSGGDDSDSCESSDSCPDYDDDDDCGSSSSSSSGSSSSEESGECDSSEEDSDEDDDDCDEDELEPGEGEAVWEEEEVEGGIEIVEECPDDEDDCDSGCCCEDEDDCDCDDDDDYSYEDGIEETAEVNRPDDDSCEDSGSCESDSSSCEDSDSCEDDSGDDDDDDDDCEADNSCEDQCDQDDEECKKKRKEANKNKKKKSGSKKKKSGSKKSSPSAASASKKSDGKKKKTTSKKSNSVVKKKSTQKKKVRYPPVQKIRKSLARALQNVTAAVAPVAPKVSGKSKKASLRSKGSGGSGGGGGGGVVSGIQNAVLNKVDNLLSIKDNGLFNKGGNSDTNTGCSIVEGWSCPRRGRYAHPIDCQKYVECSKSGGPFSKELSNTVYECEDDEAYDPSIRSCTTDWSSCEALEQCLYHRQLVEDPSDDNSYFICIRDSNKFKESYSLYRRDCTPGRKFDKDYALCLDEDDYKRINKAKRRRQQIKKQKRCQKKKAQKNKGQKKKKTPQKKH